MEKLKCSLSDKQLAKKCDDWIRSLIDTGGKSWCLNIPARPNEDPDLVFSELVRRFRGKDGVKHFPEPDLPGSEISRDWTEDFQHENGNYMNLCCRCNESFSGHKRRNICRICADQSVKQPTGILKDLKSLNRYIMFKGIQLKEEDTVVLWSDVEAIINKYSHP